MRAGLFSFQCRGVLFAFGPHYELDEVAGLEECLGLCLDLVRGEGLHGGFVAVHCLHSVQEVLLECILPVSVVDLPLRNLLLNHLQNQLENLHH